MTRPEKSYVVREGYLAVCDNDHKAAAILHQMVRWQWWVDRQPNRDGWFYKSARELSEDLMGLCSDRCCRTKMNDLRELGFLDSQDTKDPTTPKRWQVQINALQSAMEALGFSLHEYTRQPSEMSSGDVGTEIQRVGNEFRDHYRQNIKTIERETGASSYNETPVLDLPDFWDRNNREPLPDSERADMMQFQEWWFTWAGEKYDVANNRKRNCAMYALRFWTVKEIRTALKTACGKADRSPWSYFVACLEQMARGEWQWERTSKQGKKGAASDGMGLFERLGQGGQ